jgi:signal-transduction protein with cAMP-binding, CBS, and nucleotidyltransferase domain
MSDVAPLARIDSFPYQHRMHEVMFTPVLTAAQSTPLIDAIRKMYEAKISWILAVDECGRAVGVFTERDLTRILSTAGGGGLDTTLGRAMSRPVIGVRQDTFVYVALGKMTNRGLRHLVVVDDDERPVGMVTARSLLKVRVTDALVISDLVEGAAGADDMRQAMRALPQLARGLLAEGVPARNIATIIAVTVREMTARAAYLAQSSMLEDGWGPPPARYALLVLGSAGRGESLLTFDQDNAIVFDGKEADDVWFAELGKRVNGTLNAAGIPFCEGGVMAREHRWRRTLADWKNEVHDWVFDLEAQTVMYCDIFFDFQCVWGDRDLAEELRAYAIDKAAQSAFFQQFLAQNVAGMADALGLFGRFITRQGRMNVKKFGLLPLISAARMRAIRARLPATSTDERFGLLHAQGLVHEDDLRDFIEIREVMFKVMLDQQLADLTAGIPPSARVDPRRIDRRTRDRLRWAFQRLEALKLICGLGR